VTAALRGETTREPLHHSLVFRRKFNLALSPTLVVRRIRALVSETGGDHIQTDA
jgi:hypothetical protein